MAARGLANAGWPVARRDRLRQAVLQGGVILAKAADDRRIADECADHLTRYIELLFGLSPAEKDCT